MTQKPVLRAEVYARALRASQNRKVVSLRTSKSFRKNDVGMDSNFEIGEDIRIPHFSVGSKLSGDPMIMTSGAGDILHDSRLSPFFSYREEAKNPKAVTKKTAGFPGFYRVRLSRISGNYQSR
jgi:hypothetical protein